MFLGIFVPSFKKSHRKFFLTICHVSKMTFCNKISRKSSFKLSDHSLPTSKPIPIDFTHFLHRFVKTDGVARCRLKSNGHFTIFLPVRINDNKTLLLIIFVSGILSRFEHVWFQGQHNWSILFSIFNIIRGFWPSHHLFRSF